MYVSKWPFDKSTSYWIRVHVIQRDLIFTLLHMQRPYIQIRLCSGTGLGLECVFWEDTVQPTIETILEGMPHTPVLRAEAPRTETS